MAPSKTLISLVKTGIWHYVFPLLPMHWVIPSNIALKKFGPRFWPPFLLGTCDLLNVLHGVKGSMASLIVLRPVLGLVEAGIYSGYSYVLANWVSNCVPLVVFLQLIESFLLFSKPGTYYTVLSAVGALSSRKSRTLKLPMAFLHRRMSQNRGRRST